jgi:hypothetical protein
MLPPSSGFKTWWQAEQPEMELFIKTAVRTLNPTYNKMFRFPYSHGSHGGQHIFIKEFH